MNLCWPTPVRSNHSPVLSNHSGVLSRTDVSSMRGLVSTQNVAMNSWLNNAQFPIYFVETYRHTYHVGVIYRSQEIAATYIISDIW